jgi:HK97 family phage portal protein
VRIRAKMMGHFPLYVYKRTPAGIQVLQEHDLYPILHESPNQFMTSMEWREAVSTNFDLFGNAFSEIARMGDRIVALNVLPSQRMRIKVEEDQLSYEYSLPGGGLKKYKPEEVLHFRNFSIDGITGLNPIEQQRDVIGLSISQANYQAAIYKNGGLPAGVLEHPSKLTPEAVNNIRRSWMDTHGGAENAGKVAILWEGMKYNSLGMTAETAQLLESRKFQLSEVARMYGVPPHLIADLERATFSNIEQQGIEFATYGMTPDCVRFEQRLKKSLLNRPGKDTGVYARFNVAALMRGDAAARANFYASMVQNGIMSRDECRELEELTRRGGSADELTVQSNMLDLDQLSKVAAAAAQAPQLPSGGPK